MSRKLARLTGYLALAILLLSACQPQANTPPPPSITAVLLTATPQPSDTPVPPTVTPQPSDTPPPTATFTASPTPAPALTFIDSGQDFGKGDGRCVGLGDVDGDGDSDALISFQDQPSTLWLNDGMGKFTLSDQVFKASACAAPGDLNGDQFLDLFFVEGTSNSVWLNDGQGKFRKTSQNLASPESSAVALGDLDGDGDLDAFTAVGVRSPMEEDRVWLNDGKGQFVDSGLRLSPLFSAGVALGDLDGDGDLDAFVAHGDLSKDTGGEMPSEIWFNQMSE